MAIFTAGGPIAIMLFYPLVGIVATDHGWRPTFPMMGAIGLVVAALTLLVVREPKRQAPAGGEDAAPLPMGKALRAILASPAFILLVIGGTMISINYSALLAWLPAFMLRVHGLDAEATGVLMGTYKGLVGVGASLAGGLLVAWLLKFDRRWLAWAPAVFTFVMVPSQLMLLLADEPLWWHIGLAVETIMLAAINPCMFALVVSLFEPRMRATGMALFLLIFNLIGQSVGPMAIGMLNDSVFMSSGEQAVRYSLLAAPGAAGLAAVFLFAMSFMLADEGNKTP
jgi:predicted MFS family arabinose efflux permease